MTQASSNRSLALNDSRAALWQRALRDGGLHLHVYCQRSQSVISYSLLA